MVTTRDSFIIDVPKGCTCFQFKLKVNYVYWQSYGSRKANYNILFSEQNSFKTLSSSLNFQTLA